MAESLKDNITEFIVQHKREPNIKECAAQQPQKTEYFSIPYQWPANKYLFTFVLSICSFLIALILH
jgi:hypothetical protein